MREGEEVGRESSARSSLQEFWEMLTKGKVSTNQEPDSHASFNSFYNSLQE